MCSKERREKEGERKFGACARRETRKEERREEKRKSWSLFAALRRERKRDVGVKINGFLVYLLGLMFDVEIIGVWRVGKRLYDEPVA